jgi:hypothetical protein
VSGTYDLLNDRSIRSPFDECNKPTAKSFPKPTNNKGEKEMKRAMALAMMLSSFVAIPAHADMWNKKTTVTFSGPIQIPATHSSDKVMTLPAGTYVFRLADSASQRHVVQVTNPRGDKVYSTILAIPDYRVNAASKTTMYFSERKAGAPAPIKSWFYPGDNFGQRFVYPKAQAIQVAATTNQPVPSHTLDVVNTTPPADAPVAIQTPAKQEVAYSPSTFEKADATDTAGEDGEAVKAAPAPEAAPKKLPKTASPIYLIGLMGLLLVAMSLAARGLATRMQ